MSKTNCDIENCTGWHYAKGLCSRHYYLKMKTDRPLISTWRGMMQRCDNPNVPGYARYGGRGVTVCDRWRNSYEDFVKDVGPKPSPQHSLDRKDNDGDYEPGNVRWATREEQQANMSEYQRYKRKEGDIHRTFFVEPVNRNI